MIYRVIAPDADIKTSLDKKSMYNKIIETIDKERQTQNLTWEQLSDKTGISMNRIVYAFVEKYSTFHVRLKLDELIDICIALGIDICPVSVRNYMEMLYHKFG